MSAHPRAMRQIIATLAFAIGLMLACDCPEVGDSDSDTGRVDDDPANCFTPLKPCEARPPVADPSDAYVDGYNSGKAGLGNPKFSADWCPLGPEDVSDGCADWKAGYAAGIIARMSCTWHDEHL